MEQCLRWEQAYPQSEIFRGQHLVPSQTRIPNHTNLDPDLSNLDSRPTLNISDENSHLTRQEMCLFIILCFKFCIIWTHSTTLTNRIQNLRTTLYDMFHQQVHLGHYYGYILIRFLVLFICSLVRPRFRGGTWSFPVYHAQLILVISSSSADGILNGCLMIPPWMGWSATPLLTLTRLR